MRKFLLLVVILCAFTLSGSLTLSGSNASTTTKKERAVTTFHQPVQLLGVTMKGQYLFVHDEEAMLRGEACTYIYKGDAEVSNRLVVSFHCTHAIRARVADFTVRSFLTSPGQYEVREFQFAGTTEAHVVPMNPHSAHLTLSPVN